MFLFRLAFAQSFSNCINWLTAGEVSAVVVVVVVVVVVAGEATGGFCVCWPIATTAASNITSVTAITCFIGSLLDLHKDSAALAGVAVEKRLLAVRFWLLAVACGTL